MKKRTNSQEENIVSLTRAELRETHRLTIMSLSINLSILMMGLRGSSADA